MLVKSPRYEILTMAKFAIKLFVNEIVTFPYQVKVFVFLFNHNKLNIEVEELVLG